MKKLAVLIPLISLNCFADETSQDKEYSIGLGFGSIYSGLGANFAFTSEDDLKYISAGCWNVCGFGAGWIKTNLFGIESNKHGFGIFAGLVDDEVIMATETFEGARFSYVEEVRDVYGAGVSYTYFINGINQ